MHIIFEEILKEACFIKQNHPMSIPEKIYKSLKKSNKELKFLEYDEYKNGSLITYGKMRGCHFALNKAIENGENYLYIDRGYLKKDKEGNEYFRISINELYFSRFEKINKDKKRIEKFDLNFEDWKTNGDKVLIVTPSPFECLFSHTNLKEWMYEAKIKIINYFPRLNPENILFSTKFENNSPLKDLKDDLFFVYTYNSMLCIDALAYGIPVCIERNNALLNYNRNFSDLSFVEKQKKILNREDLFEKLISAQFNINEFENVALDMLYFTYKK